MNCEFKRKLPVPMEIKEMYPLSEELKKTKKERDEEIAKVFRGESDKFLLIIGPCSADREDSVLDYTSRLAKVSEKVKDKIIVIPRIYTNKPRTTGSGYKGMLHNPDPSGHADMLKGIIAIRNIHLRAIKETGLTCADEMLYPENYRYLSDILSYVAVGARSVENQQHRLTSSAISVPVGMKNPTGGDLGVMMNAIYAAQHSHTFLYRGWEVKSSGNDLTHAILRGYVDKHSNAHPNYHYEDLAELSELYAEKQLKNQGVIVDANHSNSNKHYLEQIRICKDIIYSMNHSADIKKLVKGIMIESYIEDGCQSVDGGIYGKSITDPCLGWEKSEKLIYDIAETL